MKVAQALIVRDTARRLEIIATLHLPFGLRATFIGDGEPRAGYVEGRQMVELTKKKP